MNTRKVTGDMADQIEKDRDELVALRSKCERLEAELKAWQDEFGTDDVKESAAEFDEQYRKVSQLEAQCAEMRAALDRVGTGWKYPFEHLNGIVSQALSTTVPTMDQSEQSALECAFKAQEESLYEAKTQNRIMRKALVEIIGIRFWNISADYSPKKVAERALRECERV